MDVSDKTIEIDVANVTSVTESYISQLNSLNLDSLNLNDLSVLSDFGIAVDYKKTLEELLKALKTNSLDLANMLLAMVKQHSDVDQNGANNYDNGNGRGNGRGNGSGNGNGSESPTVNPPGETSASELATKFNNAIKELSFDKVKSLFMTLLTESNNITELLNMESKASEIKKILLADNNIPKELKELILTMDDKTLQSALLTYLKGAKFNNKYNELLNAIKIDVRKTVLEKILKDYNVIVEENDLSKTLLSIYDGNNSNVSSETFEMTVVVLEQMAKYKGVTVEVLLTDSSYKDFVNTEIAGLHEAVIFNNIKAKVEA